MSVSCFDMLVGYSALPNVMWFSLVGNCLRHQVLHMFHFMTFVTDTITYVLF